MWFKKNSATEEKKFLYNLAVNNLAYAQAISTSFKIADRVEQVADAISPEIAGAIASQAGDVVHNNGARRSMFIIGAGALAYMVARLTMAMNEAFQQERNVDLIEANFALFKIACARESESAVKETAERIDTSLRDMKLLPLDTPHEAMALIAALAHHAHTNISAAADLV